VAADACHDAALERLSQRFENGSRELRELVHEQDAAMPQCGNVVDALRGKRRRAIELPLVHDRLIVYAMDPIKDSPAI
jgi:hypothetical protein